MSKFDKLVTEVNRVVDKANQKIENPSVKEVFLRDYFVASVMQGLLSNAGGPIQANGMNGWALVNTDKDQLVSFVYNLADAMLKHRTENPL